MCFEEPGAKILSFLYKKKEENMNFNHFNIQNDKIISDYYQT